MAGHRGILVYFKVNPYGIDFVCALSVRLHNASVLTCA